MNRLEIINMLKDLEMEYRLIEHPPAETIEEINSYNLPNTDTIVKNLFLRDDKKKNYYLLVLCKDKTVNLKELRYLLSSRPLSFASENDLFRYLGLKKGSVTPLGILNDTEGKVQVVIDKDIFKFQFIGIHPNENIATLWISPQNLQNIIEDNASPVEVVKI